MLCRSSAALSLQNPTRIPYSCQDQLGTSGITLAPDGAGSTVRGIGASMFHSSTLTIVHTAIRAPPGSLAGARSTMAEYWNRSRGNLILISHWTADGNYGSRLRSANRTGTSTLN